MIQPNRKFYKKYLDTLEKKFDGELEAAERVFATVNRILIYFGYLKITKKMKVLDIGSGDGKFAEVCKSKNLETYGVDGSQGIDLEKNKINFDDNAFDLIISNAVIEHLNSPTNMLNESRRLLKPTGVLIVITPNFQYAFKNFYDDPTHVRPYTSTSLSKILKINNFKEIKVFPYLINKPSFMWAMPFNFLIASLLPFKNHTFKRYPIPNFLRGNSTAMISICKIN